MLTALLLSACTQNASSPGGEPGAPPPAQAQAIAIDGSSTVYPISEAMAEAFRAKHPEVRITIGVSGTGGGFKKFCRAETAISDASRPIKESEMADCKAAGVEYVEIPVAYDGIAVVLNKENDWAGEMTVEELKKIWEPEAQGKVMKWSDVRDGWPDEELHLFGPGVDSGTYDY
ncbi:substrate-binding domain-containing protein, partial [bacterium]|nr:substrate-binding domain-containing protein [bacterium]